MPRFDLGSRCARRRCRRMQPLGRLAPVQLLAQHREVVVMLRMQEARGVRRAARRHAIAFGELEVRLPVAMDGGVAPAAHGDLDRRRVGHRDRTVRERVRRDRHQRERRHLGRDDRPAGRQRVGRRAGGRRDDHAVGAHRVDEPSVDLDRALDHAAEAAAIDDDLVQRRRMRARAVRARDRHGEQRAPLLGVVAVEHRAERRLEPGERDVGEEAEPAEVDADQRHVERREPAGDRTASCRRRPARSRGRRRRAAHRPSIVVDTVECRPMHAVSASSETACPRASRNRASPASGAVTPGPPWRPISAMRRKRSGVRAGMQRLNHSASRVGRARPAGSMPPRRSSPGERRRRAALHASRVPGRDGTVI